MTQRLPYHLKAHARTPMGLFQAQDTSVTDRELARSQGPGKGPFHPSSEKPLFAVNDNKYRDRNSLKCW